MTQNLLNFESRLARILEANPETLERIDRMLTGRAPATDERRSLKLLTFSAAAHRLNLSRSTVHRMVNDGQLPAVTIRGNTRRILESDIEAWIASVATPKHPQPEHADASE
ncbi:MAG: helix-turn-helix domain-containing protein [Verrucomicrobia bacterium]|nr:helix-turn-helix domain-containing protein [Verrucomicrobiota bacterium]